MFLPVCRNYKTVPNTSKFTAWESNGLSNERMKTPVTSVNSFNPVINYFENARIPVHFDGNCLKQEKVIFAHKQVVNIYIAYEIYLWPFTAGKDFRPGTTFLRLLSWLPTLILIIKNILSISLDFIQVDVFCCLIVVGLLKTLHKKWSFILRISPVNVTKSAVSWGFGHIYCKSP